MIRKLCLVLFSVLIFSGTSNANVIVDNFATQLTNDINRGGGFLSDATSSANTGFNAGVGYDSNGLGTFSVFYSDFGGNQNLGNASGAPTFTGLDVPYFTTAPGQWDLKIGTTSAAFVPFDIIGLAAAAPGNSLFIPFAGLENANNFNLIFTYTGGGAAPTLTLGGGNLIAVEPTQPPGAVPEPTTVMMFGTLVGWGLTHRRRRK